MIHVGTGDDAVEAVRHGGGRDAAAFLAAGLRGRAGCQQGVIELVHGGTEGVQVGVDDVAL